MDREPLWHSGYSREHPLWLFLRIGVAYRKEAKVRVFLHDSTGLERCVLGSQDAAYMCACKRSRCF